MIVSAAIKYHCYSLCIKSKGEGEKTVAFHDLYYDKEEVQTRLRAYNILKEPIETLNIK